MNVTLRTKYPCCGGPARLDGLSRRYDRRCPRCGRGWQVDRFLIRDGDGVRVDRLEWFELDLGLDGHVGCLERHRSRQTGTTVGLYCAAAAGLEDDPATPWATVCEDHGHLVCHDTLTLARLHLADPLGWCEACSGVDWQVPA